MSAPFSPLHQEKKLHFEIQLSHCRPHYLTGRQPPRSCTACTVQSKLLSPSPIAHTSGHPAPHFCVEEKQGRAQREWVFLSNWCVSSQQPPREASVSGEVGPAVCWRRCVRDGVITHCLSPPRKHMKEGCVCLAVRKREKGLWQLSRGWLAVKCDLFLAPSTRSYFKTRYWGSVWERGGSGGGGATTAEKCCLFSANTVFPGVVLQRHRGTSLCLCFVSVISVPFSIITWQLIPPGAGFWLFNLSLWIRYWLSGPPRGPAEHLNQSIPPHLTWPGPTQSSLGWLLPSLHP